MASIAAAADLGCAAVHLPVGLVDRATVATAHASGLAVAAWTVVDEDTLASVLEAGVDTVITDDVAMARRAVDGR
jgi:glycerophosphoryl diester phosphodiesterase